MPEGARVKGRCRGVSINPPLNDSAVAIALANSGESLRKLFRNLAIDLIYLCIFDYAHKWRISQPNERERERENH